MRTLLALLLLSPLAAFAQIKVEDAWVRPAAAGQRTGAFMKIHSSQNMRLVEVHSRVAGRIEIHQVNVDRKGITKLQPITSMDLPAQGMTELRPGAYQITLSELRQDLKLGDTVQMTLVATGRDGRRVSAEVRAAVLPQTRSR